MRRRQRNPDESIERLRRAAATGDPQAQARYERAMQRARRAVEPRRPLCHECYTLEPDPVHAGRFWVLLDGRRIANVPLTAERAEHQISYDIADRMASPFWYESIGSLHYPSERCWHRHFQTRRRRNPDEDLRELERAWHATGDPELGRRLQRALLRAGQEDEAALAGIAMLRMEFERDPTPDRLVRLADALDAHWGTPAEGAPVEWEIIHAPGRAGGETRVGNALAEWFYQHSEFGDEEAEGGGDYASLYHLGSGVASAVLLSVGPAGAPRGSDIPGLEHGLPVDWFRIIRSFPSFLAYTNSNGFRNYHFYETVEEADVDWAELVESLEGEPEAEDFDDEEPDFGFVGPEGL